MPRSSIEISGIHVRTEPNGSPAGQKIIVSVTTPDGREVDVIEEWGALPDIVISHTVTPIGISERVKNG